MRPRRNVRRQSLPFHVRSSARANDLFLIYFRPVGHVEIHLSCRLRRLPQCPSCSLGNSGRDRADHYSASCWHGFPPADACLESGVWTSLKGRSGSLVEQTSMALWDRAEGEFKAFIRSDVAGRRSSPAGCPRQPRHTLSPHRPRRGPVSGPCLISPSSLLPMAG